MLRGKGAYLESLREGDNFDAKGQVAGAQHVHDPPVFYSYIFVLLV